MVVIKLTIDKKKKFNYIQSQTKVLKNCENKSIHLHPIDSNIVSDIPVLIADLVIELYINHLIKLPEKANNIKSVKNKAMIKSYKLIQDQNLLFIKGVISKNIYYTSKQYDNLRHYNMNIPFECYTTITLNEFKASTLDNSFCDLIRSKINENFKYIYENDKDYQMQPLDMKEIIELDTNMTVLLEFQILQNQQVHIRSSSTNDKESYYNTPLDLEDNNNLKNESKIDDNTYVENKSDLNNLYNTSNYNNSNLDYDLENEPVSSDNLKFNNPSIVNDENNIENEPSFSSLCNQNNYNDKLDLDYLLPLYNEPENNCISSNKFTPNNKTAIKNILPLSLGSLYKENNCNDKLDLNYLINFYSNSYNRNVLHSFNRFSNYNPNSYKQLILFLCLLILCNHNSMSTYL